MNASVRIKLICDAIALGTNKRLISRIGVLDLLRENLDREIQSCIAKRMLYDLPDFAELAKFDDKPTLLLELD